MIALRKLPTELFHEFVLALKEIPAQDFPVMSRYTKVVFAFLAALICATSIAADKPSCPKSRKNCPMNNNKACNCGKECGC